MHILKSLIAFIGIMSLALPIKAADYRTVSRTETLYRTFFGVDVVEMESELDYDNGSETYEYTAVRFRYGIETDRGGSAGIEFMPAVDDKTIDPFGFEFELETGPSIGAYFTVGKPVYLRVGLSLTELEYTDVETGTSDDDRVAALDLGIGFNHSYSNRMTFYGEFTRRDSDSVQFNTFFSGEPSHLTDMISLGVNYMF